MREGFLRRLLGDALYVVYTLVVIEVLLRIAFAYHPILHRLTAFGDAGRRVNRFQMALGRDSSGADPLGGTSSSPLEPSPTLGWVSRPGKHVSHDVPVTIDEHGVRTVRPVALEHGDRPRILVLGDSFSFGDEVADTETWPHRLEERLHGVEVVNLSVLGYGHDQMLLLLEERGLDYHPDVVLLGYVGCDPERNLQRFSAWAKPRFSLEDGELVLTGSPVADPEELVRSHGWRPRLLDVGEMLRDRRALQRPTREAEIDVMTAAILTRLAEVSREAGAEPVFAYLPIEHDFLDDHPREADGSIGGRFGKVCRASEATCLDLSAALDEPAREGRPLMRFAHWNADAHAMLAEAVAEGLEEAGVLGRLSGAPGAPPPPE